MSSSFEKNLNLNDQPQNVNDKLDKNKRSFLKIEINNDNANKKQKNSARKSSNRLND